LNNLKSAIIILTFATENLLWISRIFFSLYISQMLVLVQVKCFLMSYFFSLLRTDFQFSIFYVYVLCLHGTSKVLSHWFLNCCYQTDRQRDFLQSVFFIFCLLGKIF
jgi:hypothetical protein